jgi:small subunit ribosomal protein S18
VDETRRRKTCKFCEQKIKVIDYKDERFLRRFISDRGKILPRRITGNCAKHQRQLTLAIKRGRHLAMLPFTAETTR